MPHPLGRDIQGLLPLPVTTVLGGFLAKLWPLASLHRAVLWVMTVVQCPTDDGMPSACVSLGRVGYPAGGIHLLVTGRASWPPGWGSLCIHSPPPHLATLALFVLSAVTLGRQRLARSTALSSWAAGPVNAAGSDLHWKLAVTSGETLLYIFPTSSWGWVL